MAISSCPVALNLSWNHPGGDRRAGHPRPAGRARVPEATNSWLEEASFRTALTAALLLIVAAAATALLTSAPGTAASAARNDPAGTPATSAASPQPRAITVPSVSPATRAPLRL
jgi:hypothetical protein